MACAAGSTSFAQVPAGYALGDRPDPPGVPTRVDLRLFLLDLSDVADLRQEFSVDLYVRVRWQDSRLATEATVSPRTLPLTQVWHPEIGALNQRGVSMLLPQIVRASSSGTVEYDQRIQGQFAAPLDLREFPADRQTLTIRLAPRTATVPTSSKSNRPGEIGVCRLRRSGAYG